MSREAIKMNFVFISPHFPDSYWKFCDALKRRGVHVFGVGDAPYNELPPHLLSSVDEYYCCPFMDKYENEKNAIQYLQNKYGKIDWIESNNEWWLEKDAKLRSEFDINTGIKYEDILKYKSKAEMKKYYKLAGVPTARYVLVKDGSECQPFIDLVDYPVFVKPEVGVGASKSYKLKNNEDLQVFLKEKPADSMYIMEEFIDGRIVSFDGITDHDANVIFCASHVFLNSMSDIVINHEDEFYYCLPKVPEDLEKLGRATIKAFNVQNRFFHLEFFRLNVAKKGLGEVGDIVALEVNMRPAGGYTPDLINYANSISCYDVWADSICFNENREDMTKEKYYAVSVAR